MTPLLSIRGVETYYGNIRALKGVDLDVYEGEIVTLIGSNGAGKIHADDDDLRKSARANRPNRVRWPGHYGPAHA